MIQSRVLKELDVPDITRYWDLLLPGLKEAIGIDYVLSTEEVVGWYNRHAAAHAKAQETRVVNFTFDDPSKLKGVFGCDACNLPLWVDTLVSHHHFQDSFKEQIIGDKLKSAGSFRVQFDLPRLGSLRYDPDLTRIVETILCTCRAPSMSKLTTSDILEKSFECRICDLDAQRPLAFGHLVLHFSNLHRDVLTKRMNKGVACLLTPDVAKARREKFTAHYLNWSPKEKRDAREHLGKEELVEGYCRHCLSEGHFPRFCLKKGMSWIDMVPHLYDS
ncbi:hypothetical protein FRC03_001280 [Tulasnella sp. 419]|nr:hypothetical protein FRC03_001280 [Tulasnella sp. 419]